MRDFVIVVPFLINIDERISNYLQRIDKYMYQNSVKFVDEFANLVNATIQYIRIKSDITKEVDTLIEEKKYNCVVVADKDYKGSKAMVNWVEDMSLDSEDGLEPLFSAYELALATMTENPLERKDKVIKISKIRVLVPFVDEIDPDVQTFIDHNKIKTGQPTFSKPSTFISRVVRYEREICEIEKILCFVETVKVDNMDKFLNAHNRKTYDMPTVLVTDQVAKNTVTPTWFKNTNIAQLYKLYNIFGDF